MARAKDDIERRERRISLVWRKETGRSVPPRVCRPYAELAFLCGDDRTAPPERDFLSRLRSKLAELRGLGIDVTKMSIDAPSIWRMAQDMHHEEVKRAAAARRGGTVAMELARLSRKEAS